jgi:O-antigen/teichoic acid export membrane protein
LPILFANRYDGAGETLSILMFAFGFRVLWMAALYPAFVSGDQVKQWSQVLLVALLVQVTFTILAAISWGANGAAYGVLISDALVFLLGALRLHRFTRQVQP